MILSLEKSGWHRFLQPLLMTCTTASVAGRAWNQDVCKTKDTTLDNKTAIFNNFKKKIVLATYSLSSMAVFSGTKLRGEVAKARASGEASQLHCPHLSLFVRPTKTALLRGNLENLCHKSEDRADFSSLEARQIYIAKCLQSY